MAFNEDHNLAQGKRSGTGPKIYYVVLPTTHKQPRHPFASRKLQKPTTTHTHTLHMPLREMDGKHPHPALRQASRCKTAGEARRRVLGKARDEWKEVGPGDVKDAQEKAINSRQEYYGCLWCLLVFILACAVLPALS